MEQRDVPSDEDVLGYFETLSNWGRWGPDDERGTLNHLSPQSVARGLSLAQHAQSISCAWDIDTALRPEHHLGPPQRHFLSTGEGLRDEHRIPPAWTSEGDRQAGATEYIGMVFHGYGVTHLDALSHMFWDGKMYNGYPAEWVTSRLGATKLAVTSIKSGIVTRGVLVDAARYRNVSSLEPGDAVDGHELAAILESQHVALEPGDVVLLRTGYGRRRREAESHDANEAGQAGWHASCLPVLHQAGTAVIGADTAQDAIPSGYTSVRFPIHTVGIVAMGLWLMDNCDLEALSDACAAHDRWEFCALILPLALAGCTGSPVNPVAVL